MSEQAKVIPLRTLRSVGQAVRLLDQWREQAEKMEALYEYACIRADLSEALVEAYAREVARLKAVIGDHI